ncbi:MAG TPA: acyl-CoA synthetase [Methylomirabilota bacterium]|jgi:acetyl-CoA synthetase|nr:acyl-CoA synthetase [Methylomirabilota bacterium]
MSAVLEVHRYPEARDAFRWDALWELFDGDRGRLNLAHECVDRHLGRGTALRIQFADGHREEHDFAALAEWSSRFANVLEAEGVDRGDRVAIMLEPSLAFYGAVFGTMKRGAVAVPLFTLFGPEGLALRLDDCRPRLLLVEDDADRWRTRFPGLNVVTVDELAPRLRAAPARYVPATAPDDVALFQYTSGTTRALPEAVRHTHRSVVTLMVAALYGLGLRAGDRYFCPSSPAWGHGLWHGTVAPLALGIAVGAYSGRFRADRIAEALEAFGATNLAAAPTVYRMLREAGVADRRRFAPAKLSFTGEPMDGRTWDFVEQAFGVSPCSMYGSTEVGVIIVNYPGFEGFEVRRGALGKAAPGWDVAVIGDDGPVAPGVLGEIAVRRRGAWFPVKDRGHMDAEGYFYHAGRSDDVIISAGWTMSALEIEQALLAHPAVAEAAVVGVPDALRGQIPKACVVAPGAGPGFARELQEFVKERLSKHEYPRAIELVSELPKTPAGKIDRKTLRERNT